MKIKAKTHSGAKKRFSRKPGGLVKRRAAKRRHMMKNKGHKAKRHLAGPHYVSKANIDQMERLLQKSVRGA
jgi:large subunit ribosomal protein L35